MAELIASHQRRETKLATLRLDQLRTELETCRAAPQVNKSARYSEEKTEQLLRAPSGQRVADSLRPTPRPEPNTNDITINLKKFSVSFASDQTSHSKESRRPLETSQGLSYESILKLMANTSATDQDNCALDLNDGDFLTRSMQWLQQKEVRLQRAREASSDQNLAECTFSPQLSRELSNRKKQLASKKKAPGKHPLGAASMSLSFASGFNFEEFVKNAKPLVNYYPLRK